LSHGFVISGADIVNRSLQTKTAPLRPFGNFRFDYRNQSAGGTKVFRRPQVKRRIDADIRLENSVLHEISV
jgi:hypothetical protein